MTVALAAAVAVLAVLCVLVAVWPWRRVWRRTVRVELASGVTLEGVLWSRSGGALVLKSTTVFDATGAATATGAEFVVPYRNVQWVIKKPTL